MDISDEMDKSWDHPWTTEEMRKKRRDWSLAGDAGLLKHLQQFSDNLVSKANKTQEALDSLTTELSETAILIDNVTNTSLALANTQFIESRVQEDDVETERKIEKTVEESKDQDLLTADLIASVSESVRQGLNIMDEKYKQMEVIDSDSDEEDNEIVLSVILGPNNPYQDRPLPYVIGSDKWMHSNKIGLESSSSESEQVDDDEEEEESKSDNDDVATHKAFGMNIAPEINISRLPPLLNESDKYNQRNHVTYVDNEKIDKLCENNVNSISESITPVDNTPKAPIANEATPSFAEELAKRLGTVHQAQKPVTLDERNEASINRLKDDLFASENDNTLDNKSENVFSANNEFLTSQSSVNLWKEKPKPFKTNIIPASIDVPPPISTVSSKPKSAIDDLFADADSEDSDDIFLSKNTAKKISKDNDSSSNSYATNADDMHKKYLDIAAPAVTGIGATSTPESNIIATNSFNDEDDDGDLFGTTKNHQKQEPISTPSRKKPVGGVSILSNVVSADVESKLSSIFDNDTSPKSGSVTNNEPTSDSVQNPILNDNIDEQSSIMAGRRNAENLIVTTESSYSSGISVHPPSINSTRTFSIGENVMTSTRLRSDDIYRERVVSDSLLNPRTRNPNNTISNSNITSNQSRDERNDDTSARQDDVFENDDLFGPPPLPKSDSKPSKSKKSSLFDDSDSGDELFSTTSSGSRSQKSTDFFVTTPQFPDKSKSAHRKGLFDEEIDIFGNKDSPDVDIFGIATNTAAKEGSSSSTRKPADLSGNDLFATNSRSSVKDNDTKKVQNTKPKKISLFDDDDDIDDDELFVTKLSQSNYKNQSRIPKIDEESDLFSSRKMMDENQTKETKKPTESTKSRVDENISSRNTERKDSDIFSDNALFSSTIDSRGLIFEDNDYNDLFSKNNVDTERTMKTEETMPEIKKDIEVLEPFPKDVDKSTETLHSASKSNHSTAVQETDNISNKESISKEDIVNENAMHTSDIKGINTSKELETGTKKSPPNSLNIPAVISPPEESTQLPRRSVSGKIKNLMGKMGDLKILSPMDTPPLWRRSEEKTDEEDETEEKDSNDGGCISTERHVSPPSVSEDNGISKDAQPSTISEERNVESAISFDGPVQVETLSTAASKTRVRIQAKRRPQSRHARKSALRQSGLDFDNVDALESNSQDEGHTNELSNTHNKEPSNSINTNSAHVGAAGSDHLTSLSNNNVPKIADSNISLTADDKSDLCSLSKESSMSVNKNTLLSPSTDEEDLFDVPPDLPEDPQKEDTLFFRAPVLSPVDKVLSENIPKKLELLRDTYVERTNDVEVGENKTEDTNSKKLGSLTESTSESKVEAAVQLESEKLPAQDSTNSKEDKFSNEWNQEVADPLRDSSHDPLEDPSQLFAFVTKTPSPEKGKSLLFSEDDTLFFSGSKNVSENRTGKKQVLDLFSDDTDGDLFSATLSKPVKRPAKDSKINIFDDDAEENENDSLFGFVNKKSSIKSGTQKLHTTQPSRKDSLFDDGDNSVNLFYEPSENLQKPDATGLPESESKSECSSSVTESVKTSHITDIFGDQSSGEDDIFTTKTIPKTVMPSKSLFPLDDDDDDDSHIFGKATSTVESKVKPTETRVTVKKPVMRDLKKTAKQIGEDPLSILQDD